MERTMRRACAFVLLLLPVAARGEPGDFGRHEACAIEIRDGARACRSGVCFAAVAGATVAAASQAVASAPPATTAPAPASRFARVAARGDWVVEFAAALKKPALAGNALFIFYDEEDPEAVVEKQYTALYQTHVKAGRAVAARATLAPDDGFRAGHTYRLQIAQLVGGKELLLAEGELSLE
jgi:hypothetical protein